MGAIKTQIKALVKTHGSKSNARKEAEAWYASSLKSFRNKEVVKSTILRFRPGKIYVFRYDTPKTEETLEWWDRSPVVLALDPYKGNDVGINLNLLPIAVKEFILDYKERLKLMKLERLRTLKLNLV